MTVGLGLRLRAARHETRCAECRVTWRSWAQRLLGLARGYSPRPRLEARRWTTGMAVACAGCGATWVDPDCACVCKQGDPGYESWSAWAFVAPLHDDIEHDVAGEGCPCGPTTEPVMRDDGSNGWLVTHHSLDGRERYQPREPT